MKTLVTSIYYYQDELGSTSHIASGAGALIESYQYDVYGKPRVYDSGGNLQSGATPTAKDLFTGHRWRSELGLYDDRNRFMSPDLGRFLQPDPIGFKGDASNLYRYCGNDWANRSDPLGLYDTGEMFSYVGQVYVGYGHAIADTAKGVYGAGRHPIDTTKGLFNASKNLGATAKAAGNAIARTWNSGPEGQGRVIGNVALAVVPVGGAAKAISTVGKVGEVTNAASAMNRLNLATELARAEQYAQLAAGKGTFIGAARDGERLAATNGGRAADYVKVASDTAERTAPDGTKLDQMHAYKNIKTGEVVEPKGALTQEPIQIETKFEGYHDPLAGNAIGNQLNKP